MTYMGIMDQNVQYLVTCREIQITQWFVKRNQQIQKNDYWRRILKQDVPPWPAYKLSPAGYRDFLYSHHGIRF